MDSEIKKIKARIVLAGIMLSLLLLIILGRVIYIDIFLYKGLPMLDSQQIDNQLTRNRNDVVEEGIRLEYIINNLEDMSLKEIQGEIKKNKKISNAASSQNG